MFAANLAGVGKPSEASEAFLCEKWTMPEPGKERPSLNKIIIIHIILQEALNRNIRDCFQLKYPTPAGQT